MGVVIAVVAVAIAAIVVIALLKRKEPGSGPSPATIEEGRTGPAVAEFHVKGRDAFVHFEVPLPQGEVDQVLSDLLAREAIEVVREKRHHLPIEDVDRVVAMGRRNGNWARAAVVDLETPGQLPPPVAPELLPHSRAASFDVMEQISELPAHVPGLAGRTGEQALTPLADELVLPATIQAGLRTTGVDPATAGAGDIVLGLLRMTGHAVSGEEDSFTATKGGERMFVRVVTHEQGQHPELSERDVDRFVVNFISSGCERGILVTEKYSPFAVYDRERRDKRMRFITRERLQQFVDALALG